MENENPVQATAPQADSPQVPASQAPAQNAVENRHKWWGILEALWDSIMDQSLSPLNQYVKGEWPHIRHVFDLFLLVLIIGGLCGWSLRSCRVSYLEGQLQEKETTAKTLQGQLDSERQDASTKLNETKIDSYEKLREKDAELARVVSEKLAAQQQLSLFQSLPASVLQLYGSLTNLYANDPTNRNQMVQQFNRIESLNSDIISELSKRPAFTFYLDRTRLKNETSFFVPLTNNTISLPLLVSSSGTISADGLRVHVTIPDVVEVVTNRTDWSIADSVKIDEKSFGIKTKNHNLFLQMDQILMPETIVRLPIITLYYTNFESTVNIIMIRASGRNSGPVEAKLYLRGDPNLTELRVEESDSK